MIVEKGAPRLRGRFAAADHVLGHAGFSNFDTQLEQFTMDVGSTPERILAAHPPDQIADLTANRRTAGFTPPNSPRPEQAKPLAMPGDDGLGSDDGQRGAPVTPDSREDDPQQTIGGRQLRPLPDGAFKDIDLVAEGEVLQFHCGSGAEGRPKNGEEGWQNTHEKRSCGEAGNFHHPK
jgi:hypothetical protein